MHHCLVTHCRLCFQYININVVCQKGYVVFPSPAFSVFERLWLLRLFLYVFVSRIMKTVLNLM